MPGIKGIDVSTHQGLIDWSRVAQSGVQFAILRAGYGRESSQKDSRFESYYVEAKAAGIPVGAYWYSYAMSPEEARLEAESIRSRFTIGLAHWDVDKSSYSGAYGLWQYKVGQTPGISGECDLDYAYEDFPALIKANGLNGYVKQAEDKPPENSTPDIIDVTLTVNGKQYSGKLAAE